MKDYESWGRFPKMAPRGVLSVDWRGDLPNLDSLPGTVLPRGYGRSYGDSCLNEDGILLDVTGMNRFIAFDDQTGILRCEAGVQLADILNTFVPRGWFLPTSPGTKFVSVGGAIGNDIHGKNHHDAGTWGRHVRRFELVRSSGERLVCSPDENEALYRATIGGLGLTGLITWAEIQLKPVTDAFIDMEQIRFESLDEFVALSAESVGHFEYTVSWIDCFVGGARYVRGHFMRGNHDPSMYRLARSATLGSLLALPVELPSVVLNPVTVRAFNSLYYHRQRAKRVRRIIHLDSFFYPLDRIRGWNKMYGRPGFLQYQCVVPLTADNGPIKAILDRIRHAGEGSFLTVFKTFGDVPSPGMLSFPRPGITLALDFALRGASTFRLLEDLDEVVRASGGAINPSKDARMSAETFKSSFPQWEEFLRYVDPKFSSSFARRTLFAGSQSQ